MNISIDDRKTGFLVVDGAGYQIEDALGLSCFRKALNDVDIVLLCLPDGFFLAVI